MYGRRGGEGNETGRNGGGRKGGGRGYCIETTTVGVRNLGPEQQRDFYITLALYTWLFGYQNFWHGRLRSEFKFP